VITYAILAEMGHFQQYRTGDFKSYIQAYLAGQIDFYSQVQPHILRDIYRQRHTGIPSGADRLLFTGTTTHTWRHNII